MRKVLLIVVVVAIFIGGLAFGATQFQRTTTKTVLVVSTHEIQAQDDSETLHVVLLDYDANTDEWPWDCAQAARLAIEAVEVRAPGNGLTNGELLGLPDIDSADYEAIDPEASDEYGGGCQVSFDVPDLTPSRFYEIRVERGQKRYSRFELERAGWSVRLNVGE